MPPSSDDLPGRKPPRKQRSCRGAGGSRRRSRGKQPGSPGAADAVGGPGPDRGLLSGGAACSCGRDLADAADLGVARSFQQEEIPAATAERVQHDLHSAKCACGRRTSRRVRRACRIPRCPSGRGCVPWRLYLVVFQHVPVERCRQLIADVAGAAVSEGFIHSCLARAASLAGEVVALIRALITASAVAGFDETTLRSGPAGEKKYVHGAFTEEYSAFWLGARSLTPWPAPGSCPVRRDRGLRPVPELFSSPVGAHRREPGMPVRTCCGIMRTAPRATRAPSGRCRRSGRCAA